MRNGKTTVDFHEIKGHLDPTTWNLCVQTWGVSQAHRLWSDISTYSMILHGKKSLISLFHILPVVDFFIITYHSLDVTQRYISILTLIGARALFPYLKIIILFCYSSKVLYKLQTICLTFQFYAVGISTTIVLCYN